MLPASNRGTGTNLGFPDVCKTPVGTQTVPIPYTNTANASSASTFSSIVYIGMVNALNLVSTIPNTNGDEAGTAGPTKGAARYTTGNRIVNVEKVPAINLACPTTGNNHNCSLAAVVVPAVSVVSFSRRRSATDDAPGLRALAEPPPGSGGSRSDGRADKAVLVRRLAGHGIEAVVTIVTTDIARELRAGCDRLGIDRPDSLRLDLRGCPGGDLEGALDLASRFVPRGVLLLVVREPDGDLDERRSTGGPWVGVPVEILVDGQTASAAEALALALRSAAAARIVGLRSYGKGRIEAVRAGRWVSMGEVLLADGRPLEGSGLEGDLTEVGQ